MRSGLLTTALAAGVTVTALLWARQQGPAMAASIPTNDKTVVHVLNRIGFGPRPGDVERIRAMGVQAFIDQQLHPERIPDAPMEARLAGLTTLRLSSREIFQQFALPAREARRDRRRAAASQADSAPPMEPVQPLPLEPKMPNALQRQANRVMAELSQQKMLRAAYSERQLQEVLTDFWFNHFNVDARKGQDRFMLTEYERDTIRPHVLGKFRDLLEATAKSPAMLFYLDNWMSASGTGLDSETRRDLSPRGDNPRMASRFGQFGRGINENYGRELMELHTLGVDGGYTQQDVTEVARALTGWTIQDPRLSGGFVFDRRLHDRGQKVVLGHVIKAGGGADDGEQVLDILAKHPSTAHFIATKLARRFVSDTPPGSLVDRVTARFRETDGDLREVMRTLLTSPEFLSPDAYRAKVKTPFEFVVSAVRATGTDVQDATPLVRAMRQLGMPLYMCQPPTGYKDTADAWVNTGALVNRMNFALQLAGGSLQAVPNRIVESVLDNDISNTTRDTIAKATTAEQMTALTLGSPEFQRR
ncbi:MAG: DUF1800 domain-containing protein [Acidobacteria bacterium]|nr:DUF1800 domain-containing protein [Acidobacteriota bacterium]